MKLIFWFISVCMLLLAMVFILLPFLRSQKGGESLKRKDLNVQLHREHLRELEDEFNDGLISNEEFNNAKRELEKELLIDISQVDDNKPAAKGVSLKTIIPAIIVLPVFTISLYLFLGDLSMVGNRQEKIAQQQNHNEMHSIEEMVQRLRVRLEMQPEDGEGWEMLARSYVVINKFEDAVKAYRNAHKYIGDDPQLLADYSEALILASDNSLTEEAVNLANKALQQNPEEPKALWIAGYANYQQGKVGQTLTQWERLLQLLPPGSEEANALQENINQIKMQAGMDLADQNQALLEKDTAVETRGNADLKAAPEASVDVHVSLDSALMDKTNPEDTVFIFARASEGPRMPLAIVRKQVRDLPVKVTLDDSLAMSPAMSLSKFDQVVIGARISKSGNAMPSSGDLTGTSNVVQLDEVTGVKITIDQVIP